MVKLFKYSTLAVACLLAGLNGWGLNGANSTLITLQTDKVIYVSGEEIGFKATLLDNGASNHGVLFADLCDENYSLAQLVLKCDQSECSGIIEIPDSIQTGVYLLRAYVGNERGEPSITSQLISIINRFGDNEINEKQKKMPEYNAFYPFQIPVSSIKKGLSVGSNKKVYRINAPIELTIDSEMNDLAGTLSVSVYLFDSSAVETVMPLAPFEQYENSNEAKIFNYFSISGQIIPLNNQESIENKMVLLSHPDSIANIDIDYTDRDGNFGFVLNNFFGDKDFIIQTVDKTVKYEIKVFPGFLPPPSVIPYFIPLKVERSDFVVFNIQRAQINKAFDPGESSLPLNSSFKYPFYGISEMRIDPSKYIPLADFREIAKEIVPNILYNETRDSAKISVWDSRDNSYFSNPLVLVDGVPYYQIKNINKLNSDLINWIEIIPYERTYGDLLIPSLVAIQTFSGNFEDIEMPDNAIRKRIKTFYEPGEHSSQEPTPLKDILFWNPALKAEKQIILNFNASYETGSYIAVVRGTDRYGKLQSTSVTFNVE